MRFATVARLRVIQLGDSPNMPAQRSPAPDHRSPSRRSRDNRPRYRMVAHGCCGKPSPVVRSAQTCWVEFTADRLVVADDGRGIRGATGNGLRGARERAEASGGTLEVGARAGGGTRVEVRW